MYRSNPKWQSTGSLLAILPVVLLLLALARSPGVVAQQAASAQDSPAAATTSDAATALERERAFLDAGEFSDNTSAALTQERAFLEAIQDIETEHGAYAAELSEQMLSLGLALQQQERHGEALDVLKRGVHLARINNGLYSVEQIPLLEAQIQSYMALGEYSEADDRQSYLYRVQVRSLSSSEERVAALLRQADWQYRAYHLSMGMQGLGRLTTMWELYAQALNEIIDEDGSKSPRLLDPLQGMLRTQYLIAANQDPNANNNVAMAFSSDYSAQQEASRFYAYRSQIYEKGRSVIVSIYDIHKTAHGAGSPQAAEAVAQLGDWALWNGKEDEADEVYQILLTELGASDAAKAVEARIFDEPMPLPDVDGIRPLPQTRSAKPGDILLEFGVSAEGRVTDLVRQDGNADRDDQAYRLMRELRKTIFRPRYEAGQPVETEKLVRAYDVTQ